MRKLFLAFTFVALPAPLVVAQPLIADLHKIGIGAFCQPTAPMVPTNQCRVW